KLDVISEVPQLEKEKTEILLYPNPVNNYLKIESKNETLKMVTIYDLRGSMVRSERISGISAEISTDNLPAGNYIIKVQTENRVITKRIIKQ
ncbi:MAG TPA: T9SS type A sorting domain-containing protein, partial [Paludibacteraceae bacterium]|nr:T9SS type A sorting domain-containing protein [Paludibacteraceae bacterium]